MAVTSAKISVSQKVTWVPTTGDSITFSGAETFIQQGSLAGMEVVTVTTTTAALPLFGITGDKYFAVKNTDLNATIYVDTVTPVVPTAASAKKLPPGKSLNLFTSVDTWYAISSTGSPQAVVAAIQP